MNNLQKETERQTALLSEGCAEVIPEEDFKNKLYASLKNRKPLTVKIGIDPTSPDIHLGHMVPLKKIRQFQELGHLCVLIIGDFTAQIGDPTDNSSERTQLSHAEARRNAQKYAEQAFRMINKKQTKILYQSSWYSRFKLKDLFNLLPRFSAAQMLAHETFRRRLETGRRLALHELLYPVLQAYDSVIVRPDIEIGGTDQKFNILCGRELMRSMDIEPQTALLLPLLMGTDANKMSKSAGNHIPVLSSASIKFGRIMSLSDSLIPDYIRLALCPANRVAGKIIAGLTDPAVNPMDIKLELAREIVSFYHGREEAEKAGREFLNVFSLKEIPADIPVFKVSADSLWLPQILVDSGLCPSTSEVKRLMEQGAVKINSMTVDDFSHRCMNDDPCGYKIVQIGRRRFLKIIFTESTEA